MNHSRAGAPPGQAGILRNTLWMAWSGTINIASSIVVWIALARWRDPAEVAQFATVMSVQAVFVTVCGLGLTPYLASQLAHRTDRRRLAASATLLITLWSVLCTAAMIAAGYFATTSATGRIAACVLSLSVIPSGLISVGEAVFTACGQARVIALATTTENLLRTTLPLVLLYQGASLPAVCLSFVLVRLAACVVYTLTAWRTFGGFGAPDSRLVREIAGVAPTFAGVTLLAAVHWQLGIALAGRLSGEHAAADFGVASRVLVPATILLGSYASVIQPAATRAAQQSVAEMGAFLARSVRPVLALALPLAVGGLTLGMKLPALLFGERYAGASLSLAVLGVGVLPFGVVMVAARGLVATGRQHYDLLANLAAVVVNLGANLVLLPKYGATGAACAQLLSLCVMAGVILGCGTRRWFSLHIWHAIWICRWPLAAMLAVILLTHATGFWWSLSLASLTYVVGLALIRHEWLPRGSALTGAVEPDGRPRVLMVGPHPTRTLGGISTVISDLLSSSLSQAFAFRQIVSQKDGGSRPRKLALACAAVVRFVWALVTWRPDVIYVHVGGNASLYRKAIFISAARLAGWRVVAHFHAGNFGPYYAAQSRLGRQLILRGLGLSSKFIVVSQNMAVWLSGLWPRADIRVVPNGVRTELFTCRRTYEADVPRLLFVGKMGFLKGEADLLGALHSLVAERPVPPSFRLDMLGRVSEEVRTLLHTTGLTSRVDQLGPVSLQERVEYFTRADIFVLPTYAEGLPIAVLEAMAAGLPIITTRVGGIPELLNDGVEGLLVEPGDRQALATRLALLLADAGLRRRLGERARQRAARFDLRHVVAQLGDELREEARVVTGRHFGNRAIKSSAAPLISGLRAGRNWLEGAERRAGRVLILGYHRVVADIARAEDDTNWGMVISAGTFRRHMELLRERYEVVSLADAGAILRGQAETRRPAAAVTFDDGYRDVYDHAWSILRELGVPATVFVATGCINTTQWLDHDLLFWFARRASRQGISLRVPLMKAGLDVREAEETAAEGDVRRQCQALIQQPLERRQAVIQQLRECLGEPAAERGGDGALLDWGMIRELAEGGIAFGAHTEHHPILPLERESVMAGEIAGSQQALAGRLGRPVRHFAYPGGHYNDIVKGVVRRCGFELAVSTERRVNRRGADLLALGRLCLCEESTRGVRGRFSEAVAKLRLAV